MSTVAGYTICFLNKGAVRQLAMALIERRIIATFGGVEIISRTPLGPRGLEVLHLKGGEWVEWMPFASKCASRAR
jgi:hypothetical protein